MPTSEQLKQRYEKIYSEVGIRADDPSFYPWIIRLIRPVAGKKLLDVACGEGGLVVEAQRAGLRGHGLDISAVAVEKARKNSPSSEFVAGDAERLPWPDEHFDFVTCLGSLENMINPWKALSEIVRVTRPGGTVCVQMPNLYWLGDLLEVLFREPNYTPFQSVERWSSRSGWRMFLQESGLTVTKELGYNKPAPLFRKGKLRSLRKFLVRSMLNACAPLDWSWSFVYLCKKEPTVCPPKGNYYWLYEAKQIAVP